MPKVFTRRIDVGAAEKVKQAEKPPYGDLAPIQPGNPAVDPRGRPTTDKMPPAKCLT